jgi:hypothetical protein
METKTFDTLNDLDSVVHDLAQYMLRHIRRIYPRQGRVLDITPQGQLLINIGTDQGVTPGLTLYMFGSAEPLPIEKPIGHIKIQEVYAKHAEAAVLHADLPVQRGWRVKESE